MTTLTSSTGGWTPVTRSPRTVVPFLEPRSSIVTCSAVATRRAWRQGPNRDSMGIAAAGRGRSPPRRGDARPPTISQALTAEASPRPAAAAYGSDAVPTSGAFAAGRPALYRLRQRTATRFPANSPPRRGTCCADLEQGVDVHEAFFPSGLPLGGDVATHRVDQREKAGVAAQSRKRWVAFEQAVLA